MSDEEETAAKAEEETAAKAEEEDTAPATEEEEPPLATEGEEPLPAAADDEEEKKKEEKEEESHHIDKALLGGIEPAMTEEEQILITKLMTSGDPDDCTHAARIINYMTDMLKSGVHHNKRTGRQKDALKRMYETGYTNKVAVHKANLTGDERRIRQLKMEQIQSKAWMSMHPLPRMPYYFEIETFDPFEKGLLAKKPSLTFLPGVWDGTTEAAFSTITTDKASKLDFLDLGEHKINKNRVRNAGTVHVLEAMGKGYKARLSSPKHRIVIDEIHNDAAKTMLKPGAVITHLDEQPIPPEMTVTELNKKIQHLHKTKDYLKIAVNCEVCVAEALKLRANCSCLQYGLRND